MNKLTQTLLLEAYRHFVRSGLLDTRWGERLFLDCYDIYKRHFETNSLKTLRPYIRSGATAIDVGANVGFFSIRFARWAGPGGRVIAIEPEANNVRRLRRQLARFGLTANVEVVEGVAAEQPGILSLALNPDHPADHRIGDDGIPVRAWTIDEILAGHGWPAVSLIKIDVQGAEVRVLRGARRTIERFHPPLFIEVADEPLAGAGFSAEILWDEIERQGYRIYDPNDLSRALTRAEAATRRGSLGYADYLCRV